MDINQISSIAMPIILGGIVYLVRKLIVPIGDVVIDYLLEKKNTLGINKQLAEHQNEITTAKEIWNIVEEKYRITEKVEDLLVSKSQMFDKLLLQKIPYLTQENIDDLRQAIAGEFNKGKQAVITDDTLKQSNADLQNANVELTNTNNQLNETVANVQAENENLKAQLSNIQNAINNVTVSSDTSAIPVQEQVVNQTVEQ